ncbi:hypothetical protein JCM33374_g5013 [Metschnikowia sp. JCM 33374]|nr:hypothetical protein JCM33374_g5013 [Metschnikowia sp. JCM 33374]
MTKAITFPNPRSNSDYTGPSSSISYIKFMSEDMGIDLNIPLHAPPVSNIKSSILPIKTKAQKLIQTFFTNNNSQLPILHREIFLTEVYEPIYGSWNEIISPPSTPFPITTSTSNVPLEDTFIFKYANTISHMIFSKKKLDNFILEPSDIPRRYHRPLFYINMVFAIATSGAIDKSELYRKEGLKFINFNSTDPLEPLEVKLLVMSSCLVRSFSSEIWNMLGQCLRICVILRLHDSDSDTNLDPFTKDKRRRLFWCTYSLDRQICLNMGRPVGISDASIETRFPSELDDAFITKQSVGVQDYSEISINRPSYKSISILFFLIRQLQSEMQRIVYEEYDIPKSFDTLDQWKIDFQRRLDDWLETAHESQYVYCRYFDVELISLNYNHTVLLLNAKYCKSSHDALEKVVVASKNMISCYSKLHTKNFINYSCSNNLLMAGTSFLYGIYHCDYMKHKFPKHTVKNITEDCVNVLSSLCNSTKDCSRIFRKFTIEFFKRRYNEKCHASPGIARPVDIVGKSELNQTEYFFF